MKFVDKKFYFRDIQILYTQFVEYSKKLKPETRGTYNRAMHAFVAWVKSIKQFNFTEKEVIDYKRHLIEDKNLEPNSISTYLTALRKFCNFLLDNNIILTNPADSVSGFPRPDSHTRKYISEIEIEKLLSSIDKNESRGKRDYAIIKLMLNCGLSEKELVHANVSDLEKLNSKSIMYVRGKGHTKKDEKVVIPSDVIKTIHEYLATRTGVNPSQPLFLSAGNKVHGKRMTTRGIRERVNYYLKKSGIKKNQSRKLTPYSLRHTSAFLLAKSGASPETIQKRMRLGTLKTALIYVESIGNHKKEVTTQQY